MNPRSLMARAPASVTARLRVRVDLVTMSEFFSSFLSFRQIKLDLFVPDKF